MTRKHIVGRRIAANGNRRFLAWVGILVLALVSTGCEPAPSIESAIGLIASGDRDAGVEMMREMLETDPDNPELLFVYGRALQNGGQVGAAQWPLRRAMKHPEWLVPAGMLVGNGAYNSGNYEMAVEIATQILEVEPENIDALILRADAGLDARLDYEAPLEDAERVLDIDPDHDMAQRQRIAALLYLERVEEATAGIDELVAKSVDLGEDVEAQLCASQAVFLFEQDLIEEARAQWESCLERFPTNPAVLDPAIGFFDGLQEYDRSIEMLRVAMADSPRNLVFRSTLASRLDAAGKRDEAESLLIEATEFEDPTQAWLALADLYRVRGEFKAHAEALEEVAAGLPDLKDPMFLFSRADAWLLAGDQERALELASELPVESHQTLIEGRVALERGDAQLAFDRLTRTTELWPDQPFARYYAGFAAELIGDFDRAISEYRHSIRSGPEQTDSRYRVAKLFFAQGEENVALETLSVGRSRSPLSIEGDGLVLRIMGRQGNFEVIKREMATKWAIPGLRARLFDEAVRGVAEARGLARAATMIENAPIDLKDPRDAVLLRRYAILKGLSGEPNAALEVVNESLKGVPQSADFQEISGFLIERFGRDSENARAYYERALKLDPKLARADMGLARMAAAAGDREAALVHLDRAIESAQGQSDLLFGCADQLEALDEKERASELLESLVKDEPSDLRGTGRLADLRHAMGLNDDWTLELVRRAMRFGGGPNAVELAQKVHEARGETEAAAEMANVLEAVKQRVEAAREAAAEAAAADPTAATGAEAPAAAAEGTSGEG